MCATVVESDMLEEFLSMQRLDIPCHCDVLIVGCGVAGAAAAYHLSQQNDCTNVVVLEAGAVGRGSDTETMPCAHRSGSSTMQSVGRIKMTTRLYACTSEKFVELHGVEGARRYLKMSDMGITIQKSLATKVTLSSSDIIRTNGSLYLATKENISDMENEFRLLRAFGCNDIEWMSKEQLADTPGCPAEFECGIFFPGDTIIDSEEYARCLIRAAVSTGRVALYENSPPVVRTFTEGDIALTELSTGARIASKHVVMATGGLLSESSLAGIMTPCWSYLVSLPHPSLSTSQSNESPLPGGVPMDSPNMWTWGFAFDWCWTDGHLRVSGEDGHSAMKPPHAETRCQILEAWAKHQYSTVFDLSQMSHASTKSSDISYGVYSDIPDMLPLVGHPTRCSRICYLLGCNAMGQAVLSYAATLVPGLLGYGPTLSDEQYDMLSLLTIRRFQFLPVVANRKCRHI